MRWVFVCLCVISLIVAGKALHWRTYYPEAYYTTKTRPSGAQDDLRLYNGFDGPPGGLYVVLAASPRQNAAMVLSFAGVVIFGAAAYAGFRRARRVAPDNTQGNAVDAVLSPGVGKRRRKD